jgi:hypothetical protein
MLGLITKIDNKTIIWRDRAGALHACEGADVHPGVRLFWTLCQKKDVPANSAWLAERPADTIDCPECLAETAKAEPK